MKEMVYISDPNADREILDEGYVHGYHYCIVSLGSHPADLCPNAKAGKPSCHSCGGNCSCGTVSSTAANDAALIAEITKKVLASLS